jgi:acetolactate synthase I/II/III large subunit
MKVSDYILRFLAGGGVTHIFEVCGGSITHILDSIYGMKGIKAVSMHHEQSAAFAAEAYAKVSGRMGVSAATSGPGATNLITGIGSCYFDSVPALFLTGQVNTYEYKGDRPVRQIGFQETDIVSMVKPVVKYAAMVKREGDIRYILEKSACSAVSDRPGPVLVDIPMNIQRADVDPRRLRTFRSNKRKMTPPSLKRAVAESLRYINDAGRPVILAGGGLRTSGAAGELLKFVDKTGIPVVSTLLGKDAFPNDRPEYAGMLGTYGNRYANLAAANADLLIILGCRLDTRQTGTRPGTFAVNAKKIHVDIGKNELNSKVRADLCVNADLSAYLKEINALKRLHRADISQWRETVSGYRRKYPAYSKLPGGSINPNLFMDTLSRFLPENAIVCVDIGQNQMWAAQSLLIKKNQRFLTQGGMAAMGSALPAAVGASFASPGSTVVVIAGDGGFQLNLQELETVRHHGLPVKIIILNNRCYGMVRQFQAQYFGSRFQSTVKGYSCPDFTRVVSAYGIVARRVARNSQVEGALAKLFSDKEACCLEVEIDGKCLVTPKLSVNMPIERQDPPLSEAELRECMMV